MRVKAWLGAWVLLTIPFPAPAQDFVEDGGWIEVLPGEGQLLDLPDCIQLTLTANADLEQERERLGELQGQVVSARSEAFPSIDLNANWSRSRDPSFALDESFGGDGEDAFAALFDTLGIDTGDGFSFVPRPQDIPAQSFWRTTVDGNWELRPTRLLNALRAAKVAVRQQETLVQDSEHRAVEEMLHRYHDVVLATEEVAAVEAELASRREFLEVTRRRHALDLSTPLDTLQAAVSHANLVPDLRRARQRIVSAGQELNIAMGRDPRAPLRLRVRFPLENDIIPERRALALAEARPEVDSVRLGRRLLRDQRGAQKAQNHPFLTLNGSYGYVGRDTGTLFDEGHDTWRASVTLTVPVWDGQVVRGQVKTTEASIRRVEHELRAVQREAQSEVLTKLSELDIARANLQAAILNMRMADDAYQQMSLRYEVGKADNLQVLNAQTERFLARGNLIRARYEVLSTTATLKRAMGLSPALPLSAALTTPRPEDSE